MLYIVATGIASRESEGPRGNVGRDQPAPGKRMRKRDGDGTGPRTDVQYSRTGMGMQAVDKPFDENLGFRTGNERVGADAKRQGEKFGFAKQMLKRHTRAPLLYEIPKPFNLRRRQSSTRVHEDTGTAGFKDGRKQPLRVGTRIRYAGIRQASRQNGEDGGGGGKRGGFGHGLPV